MIIHFYKFQGTGNDFVMIDNRNSDFPKENTSLVASLCHRHFGIGADGLILLENDEKYDFRMIYYNSDGKESTMCGNGGRCIVAFAKLLKIIDNKTIFIAIDGEHYAEINNENQVKLQMKDVDVIRKEDSYTFLDTGSPHHVQLAENVNNMDVKSEGASIRYGQLYKDKGGANVNFVTPLGNEKFAVRTYERGVEDETYSCGTGATAVAIAMYHQEKTKERDIHLQTLGGDLRVSFDVENGVYTNVFLIGQATFVFEGKVEM